MLRDDVMGDFRGFEVSNKQRRNELHQQQQKNPLHRMDSCVGGKKVKISLRIAPKRKERMVRLRESGPLFRIVTLILFAIQEFVSVGRLFALSVFLSHAQKGKINSPSIVNKPFFSSETVRVLIPSSGILSFLFFFFRAYNHCIISFLLVAAKKKSGVCSP